MRCNVNDTRARTLQTARALELVLKRGTGLDWTGDRQPPIATLRWERCVGVVRGTLPFPLLSRVGGGVKIGVNSAPNFPTEFQYPFVGQAGGQ